MKFGILMSNYLLYYASKSETKIFIFCRVIEFSLGDYFLWLTLHSLALFLIDLLYSLQVEIALLMTLRNLTVSLAYYFCIDLVAGYS